VKDEGFTLIEVLAALVIFSVAMMGLVSMNVQSARTVQLVNEQTLAGIVADNVIVDARLDKDVKVGGTSGEETARGRAFEWTQEIATTDVENFFKITVKVTKENDSQVLIERVAFRSRAAEQSQPGLPR